MVAVLRSILPGVTGPTTTVFRPKLPFHSHCFSENGFRPVLKWSSDLRISHCRRVGFCTKVNTYAGRSDPFSVDDGFDKEPFWLFMSLNEAFRAMRMLLQFLVEQPSQLKHIEWPSFGSTLKTATLTLVLVGLLIIALASVDSALSYLLTLILRRPA